MLPKLLVLGLSTGALGSNILCRACNADNCARAVTGTRYAAAVQASHTADCSSFMSVTVTPAAPTTTITITPTSYSVVGSNAKRTAAPDVPIVAAGQKGAVDYASLFVPNPAFNTAAPAVTARGIAARQVTQVPNLVPIYASACSGTVRYSSACSCAGITASTTYAPTPATVTNTMYAAPSVIPVCDPANNYGLNYVGGGPDGVAIAGNAGLSFDIQSNIVDTKSCCASCYQIGSECVVFEMIGSTCVIIAQSAGDLTPTDYCPFDVFGIAGATMDTPYYGFGPCGKLV